jgi:uncharacterized protein (DUF885 family)
VDRPGRWCRSAWYVAALGVSLAGCATAGVRRAPSALDSLIAVQELDGIAEDYWRFLQFSKPDLAAKAGNAITTLPVPTQDWSKRDAQFARSAVASLDGVHVDALPEDVYVSWLALRWEMEAMSGWTAFHWTNVFDFSPGQSALDRAATILALQSIKDVGTAQRFTGLLAKVADLGRELRLEYAERARRGIRLSRPAADRAIAHLRAQIAPPDSSPFGLPRDFKVSTDTAWHTQLARTVDELIMQRVNPSLDSLAAFLAQQRELGSDTLGHSRLPGGAMHYAALLRYRSTLDLTPADAHAIGLREVSRVASLVAAARRDAGLPINRDSLRAALKRDSVSLYDERGTLSERMAQLFESAVKEMEPVFREVPATGLSIGILSHSSDESPVAMYEPATFKDPGAVYLLNVAELESRSAVYLPALVLGDLMPGRHLQQGSQFENPLLPLFRRLGSHDGFVKGWEVYALEVADSVSTSLTPSQRFGVRMRELAAACGLVVDTGINFLGWSRADALSFLRAYLPDDDDDLDRDIILASVESPGSLAAAALGARELRGLRRWAMRELGAGFSLAAFHREVLRVGSIPLPVLGTHLERWIWELKQPAPPPAGARR